MSHQFSRCWLVGLLAGLLVRSVGADELTSWRPDPIWLETLGQPVAFGPITIRPPQDFRLEVTTTTHVVNTREVKLVNWNWRGAKRMDGSTCYLSVSETTLPASFLNIEMARQGAEEIWKMVSQDFRDWKRGPIEQGTLGGRPFVRTSWQGFHKKLGVPLVGWGYYGSCGDVMVGITSSTEGKYADADLPMMEAAARTLRPRTR